MNHVRCASLLLVVAIAQRVPAQWDDTITISASNLLELQSGRDPTAEEEHRIRFFDQFLVDLDAPRGLRLGLRIERYQDSPPPELFGFPTDEYEYEFVAQRYAEWSGAHGRLRLGNCYAILGHGLLLRAFELPGVVRQTRFPLVSYAESRDLDGMLVEGRRGPFELLFVHGEPVVAPDVAPQQPLQQRRSGSLSAAQASVELRGVRVGGAMLRADGVEPGSSASDVERYGSLQLAVDPIALGGLDAPWGLGLRGELEYATRAFRPFDDGLDTSTGRPHALYSNTQLAWASGALGWEMKDYHQFQLDFNDAPSLVPEFSHRLLNRTTHVLEAMDERGHQLSLGQRLPSLFGGGALEVVSARGVGRVERLGEYGERRIYEQHFVAVENSAEQSRRLRLYAAAGKDDFEGLTRIRTLGLATSFALPREFGAEFDLSRQRRHRLGVGETVRSDDTALIAILSRAGLGQLGLLWEHSDDPLYLDDPLTPEIEEEPRDFLSATLNWQISSQHALTLFAGERRGGTACVSGTCYLVPDFEGVEMRLSSRL